MSSPLAIFARRRRSAQPQQVSRNTGPTGDVIEIGHTSSTQSRKEDVDPSVCDDEEMERLREAAAQALGLELGRDNVSSSHIQQDEESDRPAMPFPSLESKQSPYNDHSHLSAAVPPSSFISLRTSHSLMTPSIVHSARSTPMSPNALPPYPCSLAALSPFAQASSSLLTHYPSPTFFAIALSRRAKQWKLRYIVFTSPPPSSKRSPFNPTRPHADFLTGKGTYDPLFGRHYHLHLFKSATPSPDEVELDRLEINEDSGVYIIDREFGGKRDVLKVAGRDIRTSQTANSEPASDELGRITWHLKLTDLHETQRWVGYIRSSVLQQRAERASLNYPHLAANRVPPLLNTRTDLDSLRSPQTSNTSSPRVSYQPPKASLTPTQSMFKPAVPVQTFTTHTPSPNPRYVEHVGAAPSHLSPTPSVKSRTHPSPSTLNSALPALRNLFRSPSPSLSNRERGTESMKEKDKDAEPMDIDPISPDDSSLGQRATALLSIFRTPSRVSSSYVPSPAAHAALIGKPISPTPYSDTTLQRRSVEREKDSNFGHRSASSVDWSMIKEEVMKTAIKPTLETSSSANGSLSPPPRNLRRPILSASLIVQNPKEEPSKGKKRSSSPPTARPPSTQSTSNSSYASAQDQPARSFESERRRSRAAPAPSQKLTPRSPSPIFEDRDGISPTTSSALNPPSASVSSVSVSMWGAQHPYSKRISVNSSASINTVSTGHGSAKHHPPPKPPPSFAPPPAPLEREVIPANGNLHLREAVVVRPLRLSLNPPAAPPTHSLPPRPDEPAYRSRRSTGSEPRGNSLLPISAGPVVSGSVSSFGVPPPPASSPPSGPLPPTPDSDNDRPSSPTKAFLQASLTRRLRIMSSPPPSTSPHTVINKDAYLRPPSLQSRPPPVGESVAPQPAMFLHMHDTPISPPMALGHSFLTVPPEDDEGEPTSLPPPPRRSSRGSKEIRNLRLSTEAPIPPPSPAGGVELELF